VATVVRNSTAAAGSTVVLTSVINVNGTDVASETITLTITDTIDTVENIDELVSRLSALQDSSRFLLEHSYWLALTQAPANRNARSKQLQP